MVQTRIRKRPRLWSLLGTVLLYQSCEGHGSSEPTPTDPQLLFANGIEAAKEARLRDAKEAFEAVVRVQPSHSGALHSLGNLAVIEGQLELAARYHGLAKAADPQQLPPLAVLHQQQEPCAGLSDTYWVSSFAKKRLYDHFNDNDTRFDVHVSMGTQLEDSGLVELAMVNFQKAAALRPDRVELRLRNALMVPVIYENASHVSERRALLLSEVAQLLGQASSGGRLPPLQRLDELALPGTFYLVYQGFNDVQLMRDIHALYQHLYPRLSPPPPLPPGLPAPLDSSQARLRVGFVSAYLRRHSVGKLFAGLITGLPRRDFEVVVFSSTSSADDITRSLSSRARVVEVPRGFLLSNRDVVVRESLDVLVFLDVGMDTHTTMWASDRLAPVQVATWGHPVTTGLPHMDYFVSSDVYEGFDGSERFSEQLVRLSSSLGFSFQDPSPQGRLPEDRVAAFLARHGLPTDRPIIGCPQSLPKFHPSWDGVLVSVLQAVPSSVLVLLYPPAKAVWKDRLHARLARQLPDPERQLVWVPSLSPSDFLSLQQASAVVLDPFPFGGGVTTLEALAVCTPVLTLPARQTVPRLAAGMLQALGGLAAQWLVAQHEDDMVERAVQLASNHTLRAAVSQDICQRKHVLYSSSGGKAAAREWADFLTRAAGRGPVTE